jgi:glycosyltransferase involved in cell wall biosynthesis
VDRALRVLAQYLRYSPSAHLTIVGDGPSEPDIRRQIAELGLTESVTMVGTVDSAHLASVYQSADALLLPSEFEGLPLVALEALASGLPVVASDVGGLKDIIRNGDNGFRVAKWDDPGVVVDVAGLLAEGSAAVRDRCTASVEAYRASRVVPRLLEICASLVG